MLSVSEIMQALRKDAAGEVVNTSTVVEVAQVPEAVLASKAVQKATRPVSTRDVPSCELRIGEVVARFTVDELDGAHPRWVYEIAAGSTVLRGVVGNVLDVADVAHELAGLGAVVRTSAPTRLGHTFAAMDTTTREGR